MRSILKTILMFVVYPNALIGDAILFRKSSVMIVEVVQNDPVVYINNEVCLYSTIAAYSVLGKMLVNIGI